MTGGAIHKFCTNFWYPSFKTFPLETNDLLIPKPPRSCFFGLLVKVLR